MVKRVCIILLLLLCSYIDVRAQRETEPLQKIKRFNYGSKIGFDATNIYMKHIEIGDQQYTLYDINSQIGMNLSLFGRYNLKQFYIQSSVSLNYVRASISIDKNSHDRENTENNFANFNMKGFCMDIPLHLGYKLINDNEYFISIYGGPRLRLPLSYQPTFVNFGATNIEESLTKTIIGATVGINCSISKTFIEFEYTHGLNNISNGITILDTPPSTIENIVLDRSCGTFSFSIGMIF